MIFHLIIFALLNFIIYLNIDFLINKFNVYDLPDSNRKQHQNQISVFARNHHGFTTERKIRILLRQ